MRISIATVALFGALAFAAPALATSDPSAAINELKALNVITFHDLNVASQHIEGKAWVGGNQTGNLTVTQKSGPYTSSNYNALTVGGNAATWDAENGAGGAIKVQIGGSSTGQATINGTGSVQTGGSFQDQGFNASSTKTAQTNVAGLQSSIATQTASMVSDLKSLSTYLGGLSGTQIANLSTALSYSAGAQYAVFNMSESVFETSNSDFKNLFANMPSDVITVINVAGLDLDVGGGTNFNAYTGYQNVIWNFTQATTLDVGNWYGTILSPYATLTQSGGGNISGTVVADTFNMNGEVHVSTFQGSAVNTQALLISAVPPAVPETATWMMMVMGFGTIGAALRASRRTTDAFATR
jgi:choice-of-anchor A domain-containing protein